jgi:hypothetical protein
MKKIYKEEELVEEITYYNKSNQTIEITIGNKTMDYDEAVERYGILNFDLMPDVRFKYKKPLQDKKMIN